MTEMAHGAPKKHCTSQSLTFMTVASSVLKIGKNHSFKKNKNKKKGTQSSSHETEMYLYLMRICWVFDFWSKIIVSHFLILKIWSPYLMSLCHTSD